jgi:7-carboxy-7-deazaguanine synthase
MSVEEILERVSPSINHVVLTGGEPMLFDPIEELAQQLKTRGHLITIETAGTVFRRLPCDLMSISPKLSNSTPGAEAGAGWTQRHEATRLDCATLQDLIDNYNYQLKFVVNPDTGEDAAEIDRLLSTLRNADPARVLLMAEGTDSEALHRRQRLLVNLCMQRGWRLTPRLHIDLFGNSKGT